MTGLCCRCDNHSVALDGDGLCAVCTEMVYAEATVGYYELLGYLAKVSAFQRWLVEHGRVFA